ncbi:ATP-binding protein [Primorskyibacter sp. S87]|uniref:sensor histidine kinase n=1 Tax=Primorskyibacter sp. S87 TaxID=3415126 RepID=UPI003C7BA021
MAEGAAKGVILRNARTRLVLAAMALSTVLTSLVLALVYVTATTTIEDETRSVVNAEIAGLADDYERLGILGLARAIERRSEEAYQRNAIYLLTDARGAVIAGNLTAWPPTVEAGSGWVELDLIRAGEDRPVPVAAASIRLPGGERVLVGRDASARLRFDRALARSVGLAALTALVLSLFTAWLLTRLVFSRVKEISQTADDIMSGELGQRIPVRGSGDEFDRLALTLNSMLDRIEELVGNLRMTTDSLSHDLRSPLTRLRGQVSMLVSNQSQEDREQAADRAVAEVDHLLRVFSRLTEISRAEAGMGRAQFEPVDLNNLARNAVELYEPVAEDREVTLSVIGDAPALPGHKALLAQALSNLLENALRYAPDGSDIELCLESRPDAASLSVRDRGPGVPEAALETLARPFVTLDEARADQNSGLGLALVAAIARLHGGTLTFRNLSPGFEARLEIRNH